jgi:hypothetical protein
MILNIWISCIRQEAIQVILLSSFTINTSMLLIQTLLIRTYNSETERFIEIYRLYLHTDQILPLVISHLPDFFDPDSPVRYDYLCPSYIWGHVYWWFL